MQLARSYFFSGMSRIPQVGRNAIKFPNEKGCIMLFDSYQNLGHYLYSRVAIAPTEFPVKKKPKKQPTPKDLHFSILLMDSWQVTVSEEGPLDYSEGLPVWSLKEVPSSPAAVCTPGLQEAGGRHDESEPAGDGLRSSTLNDSDAMKYWSYAWLQAFRLINS